MKFKDWQKFWKRLSGMDRAEWKGRLLQELAKRQDGSLYWLGYDFARARRKSGAGPGGAFFFGAPSVEPILDLLRARFPGYQDRIVAQAEKICRHRFDLLGYTDLDYGSPIDWHLDAVHGKRALNKLFYRVRYLDFAEVGDSKVTWELNRHQHLVTLAKAYRLTGDGRYADEILRQWRDWRAENPYPVGINWTSSLEAAFRSLSWLWAYHLLAGAPGLPEIRQEWLRGFALHGRHIERYLSTYFSPNTHLLGEGAALFFLGVLCPELTAAKRWQSVGWEIILREAERQVQADGFHFEQSTYYHVYAVDFFLHSAILASLNGVSIPKQFEDTLEKMLHALCLLGRGGPPASFGDDDGGRLFDGRRNRREHLLDPLSTGAVLFHRGDFKFLAGDLREETIWLLGVEGARQWEEMEAVRPDWDSTALETSGFYMLMAEKPATQLVLDAGPMGAGSGGHGHADALSVCLQSQGQALLVDPGTYQYVGQGGDRDWFRGTAMHNTLRVDGANQAEPATPFSWKQFPASKVDLWIRGRSFDLLVASHDGYQRLTQPVVHRRQVVNLRNGIYLVRDVVEGLSRHQLDISWHLAQDMQMVAEGVFRLKSGSQGLALLAPQGHGWAQEVRKDVWSPAYGEKAPMTVVNFGLATEVPAEFATLLVTLEQVSGRPGELLRLEGKAQESGVRAYRYEANGSRTSFFFAEVGRPWRLQPVSSDAQFVCWRQSENAGETLILCNGTYASVEGGPALRCRRGVVWAEVNHAGSERTVFSSDLAAIEEETAGGEPQPETTSQNLS
jgi:hypothetical protein